MVRTRAFNKIQSRVIITCVTVGIQEKQRNRKFELNVGVFKESSCIQLKVSVAIETKDIIFILYCSNLLPNLS